MENWCSTSRAGSLSGALPAFKGAGKFPRCASTSQLRSSCSVSQAPDSLPINWAYGSWAAIPILLVPQAPSQFNSGSYPSEENRQHPLHLVDSRDPLLSHACNWLAGFHGTSSRQVCAAFPNHGPSGPSLLLGSAPNYWEPFSRVSKYPRSQPSQARFGVARRPHAAIRSRCFSEGTFPLSQRSTSHLLSPVEA